MAEFNDAKALDKQFELPLHIIYNIKPLNLEVKEYRQRQQRCFIRFGEDTE